MSRLLRVELRRLTWRRAVIVLLIGCVLLPAVLFAGLAWETRPVSAADLERAEREVERYSQMIERDRAQCVENPQDFGIGPNQDPERMCQRFFGNEEPQVDWFLYRSQLDVGEQRMNVGFGVVTVLVLLVMLIGTTFAGHDWNSGSMSNQLLFEPRRLRLWAAKAGAVVLTGLVVSTLVLGAFWVGIWALAESRDIETSAATWDLVRNTALRGIALVGAAGLGGFALTMLFRSTVATLGILFAVALAGNLIIAAVLGDIAVRWLLPTNVAAWLFNGFDYFDPSIECPNPMRGCDQTATLSLAGGATYLGVLLVIAVGLSMASFRRRDVG